MRAAIIGGSGVDVTALLGTVEPRSVDTPFGRVDVDRGAAWLFPPRAVDQELAPHPPADQRLQFPDES